MISPLVYTQEIFQYPDDLFLFFSKVVALMNYIFTLQAGKNTRYLRHRLIRRNDILYSTVERAAGGCVSLLIDVIHPCCLVQSLPVTRFGQLCLFSSFLQFSSTPEH